MKVAMVKAASVNVRSGPGTDYAKIGSVDKGDKLIVIKVTGDWRQVILADGKPGWINSSYLALLQTKPRFTLKTAAAKPAQPSAVTFAVNGDGQTGVVVADKVNVRSGPGTVYKIVAVAAKATRVSAFTEKDGWSGVKLPDGTKGWMASRYVDFRSETASRGGEQGTQPPTTGQPATNQPPASNPSPSSSPVVSPANPPVDSTVYLPQTQPATKLLKLEPVESDTGSEAIAITGDSAISYTVTRMKDPERLVIDIRNADKGDIAELIPVNQEYLSQVRVSQFSLNPMTVRIVADLSKVYAYKLALSADKHILTVSFSEPTIRGKTIVVDAGHGGYDPGAKGVTGLEEKKVNLDIALKVQKLLTDMGANVIMTRSDDTFIPLSQRATIANNAYADVFVSIHSNSSTSPSLGGTSTYYYAPGSNALLYSQLAQRSSLAEKVQYQLAQNLGIRNIGTLTANFAVLRETTMPSILAEIAFLSNKSEEALLKDDAFRDKAAQAIAQGLVEYFASPM